MTNSHNSVPKLEASGDRIETEEMFIHQNMKFRAEDLANKGFTYGQVEMMSDAGKSMVAFSSSADGTGTYLQMMVDDALAAELPVGCRVELTTRILVNGRHAVESIVPIQEAPAPGPEM